MLATWIVPLHKLSGKRANSILLSLIASVAKYAPFCYPRPRSQDEGSSFQRVLEEARHQLARHYLNNPVLELNEAAYLLGYEDGNSFVRALRTWEGVPPARWRENNRPRAAS
jgi:AraC-like DNA-binding protein